jgi:hypothetical protein
MQLPHRPNLRHLRDQAKDLVRSGAAQVSPTHSFKSPDNTASQAGPS